MQKLRIEIMSLSYHPPCLADVSISAVAVHRGLALPVLTVPVQHDSKLIGCPVVAEPAPGILILNQPINPPGGGGPWLDRPCGPGSASSPASTPACKKELHLHVKVKNQ
jgi:hypothetical protein